jgi:hypothetical protein
MNVAALKFDPEEIKAFWDDIATRMRDVIKQSRCAKDEVGEVDLAYQRVLESKIHKISQAYVKFHWGFMAMIADAQMEYCSDLFPTAR